MLFAIVLMTAIILASSFGLHVMPLDSIYKLSSDISATALYVCPSNGSSWDSIANAIGPFTRFISMFFFFALMLLLFNWGWALYQNLLKDSFNQNAFKNPWGFTKMLFWAGVIVLMMVWTPNHYRSVHIQGAEGNWVLCESNSPGAIPVRAEAVKR